MREAIFENKAETKKNYSSRWNSAAAIGFISGLLLMLAALLVSAFSYVGRLNFNRQELLMFAASFALLMLGAHFLDLAEKEIKRKKKEELNL